MTRTYSELIKLRTFEERFKYLMLDGKVAEETFGYARYLNQQFYKQSPWLSERNNIIIRDKGCDLGIEGMTIQGVVYVHHINPITKEDILTNSPKLLDPENLICVSYDTHQAITYGDMTFLDRRILIERQPFDTCPWK